MGNNEFKQKLLIIFYCTILASTYFGLSGTGEAFDDSYFTELKNIFEVTEKQQIEVTEWTLYTREHLNHWNNLDEYKEEFNRLREKTKHFQWDSNLIVQENGQMRAVATLDHPDFNLTEMLTYIVFPHNEVYHSYLIYEVKGLQKHSTDQFQTFIPLINSRLEDLFKEDTKIFTCVTGNTNDKLNFGLYKQAEMILNDFSAKKIEQLKEETFISISAYNNTWNNAIQTSNNKKMNLQVAIRTNERLGGKTTVTIGTPIITTEY